MSERRFQTGVVVIGRNEGGRLSRCLASLESTGGPVVYVDSNSSDGSAENAAKRGAKVVILDPRKPFTAARARAEGFDALEGSHPGLPYVFFVDGDCEVEPEFIEAGERFLATNSEFAVLCGRRRERFPEASPYNFLIDEEWSTPVGEATTCGGDALYRAVAYRAAGGFSPVMLAGEEPELCARLRATGWKIMRLEVPMTVHDAAMVHFRQWWLRAVRSGMGYAQAWVATRSNGSSALYRTEILRALVWAGALPLTALALAVILHAALIGIWPLLAGLQWLRLASRTSRFAALLSILGKYAELIGIASYVWRSLHDSSNDALTYK